MSDAVAVALIAGIFNIIAIAASRALSSQEHKKTARDVTEIKDRLNGKSDE